MKLNFVGKSQNLDISKMEKVAQAAFSYLGSSDLEGWIELKFVSDREIQRLNLEYRGVDKPTDILSFHLSEEPLVGQLFICYTYTSKQAKSAGKTLESEVMLLIVHGILHIFGYDHGSKLEEEKMQGIEKEILNVEGYNR